MISTEVMFQAQNRETINSTWKVVVSFEITMTTIVTRLSFTTQHQTCKTKTKTKKQTHKSSSPRPRPIFWSQTGLVQRPTVSDLQDQDWCLPFGLSARLNRRNTQVLLFTYYAELGPCTWVKPSNHIYVSAWGPWKILKAPDPRSLRMVVCLTPRNAHRPPVLQRQIWSL